jgi:hypothetical protein
VALVRAIIATRWIGNGQPGNPWRPRVASDFVLDSYNDLVGQPSAVLPPVPNVYLIDAVLDDTVLTAIRASAGVLVLWDESQDPEANLTVAQRTAVLTRLQAMGYDLTDLQGRITLPVSRKEAIRILIELQRRAQKG